MSLVWIGFATEGTEFTEMVFEAARRTRTTTRIPSVISVAKNSSSEELKQPTRPEAQP